MEHKPTVYHTMINSLGQSIDLIENPIYGDEAEVIAVCHDLHLAQYTTFFDLDDMLADHREYEPKFIDNKFYIGDMLT